VTRLSIACDVLDSRLQLAKEMGATVILNSSAVDVAREVEASTGSRMCDVAFEGSGKPGGVALTSKVIRDSPPPGNIVLYGYHAWPDLYDLRLWGPEAPVILTLHPKHSPDQKRDLEIAMQAITRGLYRLRKLISHRYHLEEAVKGFEALANPPEGYIKGMVTP
jgi:L-iditol 2-dehydrogenase